MYHNKDFIVSFSAEPVNNVKIEPVKSKYEVVCFNQWSASQLIYHIITLKLMFLFDVFTEIRKLIM